MIHCGSPQVVYNKRNVPFWLVSAFKAGFINSTGFLLSGEFVSHVTGFGSRVGITMGHDDYLFGFELLLIPGSFIFGGVVTSLLLDKEYLEDAIPPYYRVQGLITFLILVVLVVGKMNLVSDQEQFGADGKYTFFEISVVSLLCFICGLKNSLVAWTTFGKVRVTHLTGLSTDIGLNFVKMFDPSRKSSRFKESPLINVIRILIFFAFSTGAFISALMFPHYGFDIFYVVLFLSLFMTVVSVLNYNKSFNSKFTKKTDDHFKPLT